MYWNGRRINETDQAMIENETDQAMIEVGYKCRDCGYPIVFALCNDPFSQFKDAAKYDYWHYCSNKMCKNHDGHGFFSCKEYPEFVTTTTLWKDIHCGL